MIVAHLLGGVDAFLKVSQGWPLSNSPLKLISLKSSDHQSKQISLSFFCKVEVRFFLHKCYRRMSFFQNFNLSNGDFVETALIMLVTHNRNGVDLKMRLT